MTTQRSRTEILDEVEELAYEVRNYDPEISIEAARSIVFEEVPELYDEFVASTPQAPQQPISKAEREPTLSEEIFAAVRKQAGQLAWTEWPTKTIEQLELEVWSTPDGEKLYSLYASPEGRLPISAVHHQIHKSHQGDDRWNVLRRWLAG